MQHSAKIIRVLTAPPFLAAAFLLVVTFGTPATVRPLYCFVGLAALVALPLVAYPVSLAINKSRRRAVQRGLAVVLSVVGYLAAFLFALLSSATSRETVLFATYLFSGVLIALCSFAFRFKASGHTCGLVGPIVYLICFCGWYYAFALLLLLPVIWASVKTGRHTLSQLIAGAFVPVIAFFAALFMFH